LTRSLDILIANAGTNMRLTASLKGLDAYEVNVENTVCMIDE